MGARNRTREEEEKKKIGDRKGRREREEKDTKRGRRDREGGRTPRRGGGRGEERGRLECTEGARAVTKATGL